MIHFQDEKRSALDISLLFLIIDFTILWNCWEKPAKKGLGYNNRRY